MRNVNRYLELLFLALLLVASPTRAQWQFDGTPLSTAANGQFYPKIVSDGAGGAIVTWYDNRIGTNWDIYVQRVNALGVPQWTADGVALCTAAGEQSSPMIVSDGAGGAIVTWFDFRSGTNFDIYAQRVNASGVVQWTADGVALCTAGNDQWYPTIVADGSSGAIVAWSDSRSSNPGIYVQRLNASGVPQWTADGVALCTAAGGQEYPQIASDGVGGAIVSWADYRSGNPDIYARRVNASGVPQWTANGVGLCTAPDTQWDVSIASDGAGGVIVAWHDYRNGANSDIYVQRVNVSGVPQWTADGVGLCTAPDRQSSPSMLSDGAGGVTVTWYDWRSAPKPDVYAQRLNASGVAQWIADGVALCTAVGDQAYPTIASDGIGGAIVTWEDWRTGYDRDIYAQRVNASGVPQWTADGLGICTDGDGYQEYPAIVSDGGGGAIVTWQDDRDGNRDIYAQRVTSTGAMHQTLLIVRNTNDSGSESMRWAIEFANTAGGPQTIEFDIPGPGPHVISPSTPLPLIVGDVVVDGFSQPGALPNTNPVGQPSNAVLQIVLEGTNAGPLANGLNFQDTGEAHGLVIQNFQKAGILVEAYACVIDGCYIGTDFSGSQSRPNGTGLDVGGDCRVGGPLPAQRTVVSGNTGDGIFAAGGDGISIQGCYIGAASDLSGLSNGGSGIRLMDWSYNSRIGAQSLPVGPSVASQANIIAVNDGDGVTLDYITLASAPTGNLIAGNSIYANGGLGIDLDDDGITPNDTKDEDAGSNGLQNHPILEQVGADIRATVSSGKNETVYVHFYRTGTLDPLTGQYGPYVYLGEAVAMTDENGEAVVDFTPSAPIPPDNFVVATETGPGFDTSEFSAPVEYLNTPLGNDVTVDLLDEDLNVRASVTYTEVRQPGQTILTTPFTPPVPVSGFVVNDPNDPAIYFEITTTAVYVPPIEVCLHYDEQNLPGPEASLRLIHYDGSSWVDVTTSQDIAQNILCGEVSSLSPFVIAVPIVSGAGDTPAPTEFALHANIPNPFNPQTTIHYEIPDAGAHVNISIYDVAGRLVRELVDEHRATGRWSVQWNGDDDRGQRVASGVYFYRMRAGVFVDTKKMVLLK